MYYVASLCLFSNLVALLYFCCCLVRGNLSPNSSSKTQTECNHSQIAQTGKGLQITAVLFINTDSLPTLCNQSESVCADE